MANTEEEEEEKKMLCEDVHSGWLRIRVWYAEEFYMMEVCTM